MHFGSLQAFRTLFDFELNSLAFCQCLEAVTLDCGEVNEHIVAAVGRSNKAEAFGFVKPLNGSCSHENYLNQNVKICVFNCRSLKVKFRSYRTVLLM